MDEYLSFYIDGEWVRLVGCPALDITNPANEATFARIALGTAEDVDQAVSAARRVLSTWRRRGKAAAGAAVTRVHISPRGQHQSHRTR
jgi:aldehyde dehydrogenase (NAD+)